MAQTEPGGLTALEDLDLIVDADSHVHNAELIADIHPYVDDKYSWGKKMLEYSNTSNVFPGSSPTPEYGIRYHGRMEGAEYLNAEEGYTLDVKFKEMEDYGIDFGVLDPGFGLNINTVANSQIQDAVINGYNNWILDRIEENDYPYKITMLTAPDRPETSAEEIDRIGGEDDIAAVSMPAKGIDPPPGDRKYDPIYEAAENHGLPVVFHGSIASVGYAWPGIGRNAETTAEAHTVGHPFSALWNITTMILRGVPERFPDLDFVYQECGLTWIPYLKWRLDDKYLENQEEMVLVEKMPSEYFDESFYFTSQPIEHGPAKYLSQIIEMIGPDNLMYSADLPHPDHDPPQELFDIIRNNFSEEEVEGMMGENANEVYDLGQ